MASEQDVQYHRSFLSQNYTDNFSDYLKAAGPAGTAVRQDREILEIRNSDPEGFEEARKALAALKKVPYQPEVCGSYQGDRGGGYCRDGNPSNAEVVAYLKPQYPPQGAVKNPTTGLVAIPAIQRGTIEAYRNGPNLLRTSMYFKMDQQFDDYATDWEKAFGALTLSSHLGYTPSYAFTPIVDENWQVIGYYGKVQGGRGGGLLVPSEAKQEMLDCTLGEPKIKDYIDQHVPMIAWPGRGHVPGWESGDFGVSDFTYGVRTQLDGRVLSAELVANRDGVAEDIMQAGDIIFAVKALVSLGVGLVKVVALLPRASVVAGRLILRGASILAAKLAAEDLEKVIARRVAELVADTAKATAKRWGRRVTAQELEALVKQRWNRNLHWLQGLRDAQSMTGVAKSKAVIKALEDMKELYGRGAAVVPEGTNGGGALFEGPAGWVLKRGTSERVLAIERQLLQNPDLFYEEVVHDIAFDLVREPTGVLVLENTPHVKLFNALELMEQYIKRGESALQNFRGAVAEDNLHPLPDDMRD